MMMHRTHQLVGILATLLLATNSFGQLEVRFFPIVPQNDLDEAISTVDISGLANGVLPLQALSGDVDVTNQATWVVQGNAGATFFAPGWLLFHDLDSLQQIRIRAEFAGEASDWLTIRIIPLAAIEGEGGVAGGAVGPGTLKNAVQEALDYLKSLGYPSFWDGFSVGKYYDNKYLQIWSFGVGYLPPDWDGAFVQPGVHAPTAWWKAWLAYTTCVVLQHEIALAIVNGEWEAQLGTPSDALKTLIHELLHALIHDEGLQDDFIDIDHEEGFVHHFESQIFPFIVQILNFLEKEN